MSGSTRSRAAGRYGVPPRLAWAAFAALLLSTPSLLLALASDWAARAEYDRAALAAGEIWRAITCHWTHWTFDHLAWDLAPFALLATIGWLSSPKRLLLVLGLSAALIPFALWFLLPEMVRYRGLSGVDSALFVLAAITLFREEAAAGRRFTAAGCALALVGFGGKVVFELASGTTLFADSTVFIPVPLAHVVGGLCGCVVGGTPGNKTARPRRGTTRPGRVVSRFYGQATPEARISSSRRSTWLG